MVNRVCDQGHMAEAYTHSVHWQATESVCHVLHNHLVDTPKQIREFWGRLLEASNDAKLPVTFAAIARELDIWPSAVQKWREGLNYPEQKHSLILARNRGVSHAWLMENKGPKRSKPLDDATKRLLEVLHDLDDTARQRLLNAAEYEERSKSSDTQKELPILKSDAKMSMRPAGPHVKKS